MTVDLRRERARVVEGNHVLAASVIAVGAIALADARSAALTAAVLIPIVLLARRGKAMLRRSFLEVDDDSPLADSLERAGSITLIEVEGPLLFLSVPHIDRLLPAQPPWPSYVIVDLRAATAIDASALSALCDLLDGLRRVQGEFLLICTPASPVDETLRRSGLAAQALGGTTCFRREHALARIAARHPDVEEVPSAPGQRPRLYLVATPAE